MILHICCNLSGTTVFPQLFSALAAAGVEQRVFVPEKRRENLGKNVPAGVETVQRLTVRRSDAVFFFRKAARSVPVIRREMALSDTALLHAHTLFTDGSIAARLSRETGIPYGVTVRYSDSETIWRYEPHLRPLGRAILRGAAFIVFPGPAAMRKALLWFPEGERAEIGRKFHVIPNGILPAWLDGTPREAPRDPLRVGFAGRLNARKRPMDAVRAARLADEMSGKRFAVSLCGDGPQRDGVRAMLRPEDRLAGRLSGMEAMKAFYREIDVLLVPSVAETFGMVYLEAMSQGVPVLYTAGQGFDGQFPAGEVGFAVPAGKPAGQAKLLLRAAFEDYAARSARCVAAAAETAWPKVAARWKALYAPFGAARGREAEPCASS